MKRKGNMPRKWIMLITISILGLILIVYGAANRGCIAPGDWMQIMLLLTLVVVTGFYAWFTYIQANASMKMAEEMKQQRLDSKRPILAIDDSFTFNIAEDNTIALDHIRFKNEGVGPALNVRCTLTYPDHSFGTHKRKLPLVSVGAPRQDLAFRAPFIRGSNPMNRCEGIIRLEYTDVFGYPRWSQVSFIADEQRRVVTERGPLELG